jgi:glycosyltransferase involved in cell wall biosynthesis
LWRNAVEKFATVERLVGHRSMQGSLTRLSSRRLNHLAISEQTAGEVQDTLGCAPVQNIRNCRRMPERYLDIAPPQWPPVVLNVASVNARKAPDIFVETAIKVCARNPDVKFRWIGGRAPAELQDMIARANLSDRIEFIDHVDDPFQYMHAAYCLFLTSREEAFGLVLAEAMACARTTLCFARTGAAEVAGDTGRVFEIGDDALLDHLDDLLRKTPEQAVNLAARDRYFNLYSPASYARNLAEILKNSIAENVHREQG